MTKDVNEQTEAEEIEQEASPEIGGAAPRQKGGRFWVVTTIIFVVFCAVLAWLYAEQLDQVKALERQANLATRQAASLGQANRRVSAELAEVVSKLREVVKVIDELEGAYPAAAEPPAEKEPVGAPGEVAEPEAAEEDLPPGRPPVLAR